MGFIASKHLLRASWAERGREKERVDTSAYPMDLPSGVLAAIIFAQM